MDFEPKKTTPEAEAQVGGQLAATEGGDGDDAVVSPPTLVDDASNGAEAAEEAEVIEEVEEDNATPKRGGIGPPLALGSLINDRYEVLSCLNDDGRRYLYTVKPRVGFRCWSCGYEDQSDAAESALFCEECGAALNTQPLYLLDEPGEAASGRPGPSSAGFALDGRRYRFVQSDDLEDRPDDTQEDTAALPRSPFVKGVRLTVGAASDNGLERDLDEDSVLTLQIETLFEGQHRTLGVFALADGMGGYEGGEIASRLAIQAIADVVATRLVVPWLRGDTHVKREDADAVLKEAVGVAHQRVRETALQLANQMGTTVTMALVADEAAYIANVGDSRTYFLGPAGLTRITQDHSLVESLVVRGILQSDEVFSHPDRNVILRVVGDQDQAGVEADLFVQPLTPGSYLMLCCDGVWEMIQDPDVMAGVIQHSDTPQGACEELVRQANTAGGEDNISVIIVKIE